MVSAPIKHIALDQRGVAYIDQTTVKVTDVVIDAETWNLSPREIQENYPRLTPAQIYSALAYYHDHKAEVDSQLEELDREYVRIAGSSKSQISRESLEARRLPHVGCDRSE